MCGIAGIITNRVFDVKQVIGRMQDLMNRRGPDSRNSFCDITDSNARVIFSHNRLSIIDLTQAAAQPMSNEDNSIVMICNGEIYNYVELRHMLISKGHVFKSNSDNEVILHLYEENRAEALKALRGMFSFALWDKKAKELFVARDRLGIKPLYYSYDDTGFIFSSELKAIAKSKLVNLTIDMEAVELFLRFGSVPYPKTIYNNVLSLEPGHYIIIKNKKLIKNKYWDLSDSFQQDQLNFKSVQDAKHVLREKLEDAIKIHMVSDVPIGIFLSGGVDSSSLVSLARAVSANRIKTISAVFPNTAYDESCFARIVAKKFNTEHIEVKINEQDLGVHADNFFTAMDQPTIDGFNTFLVSWAAKQLGLKVCLSGLGADELFAGYSGFAKIPRIYNALKTAEFFKLQKFLFSFSKLSGNNKIKRLSDMFSPSLSMLNVYLNYRGIFSSAEAQDLMHSRQSPDILNYFKVETDKISCSKNKISVFEMSAYMANQLLKDSDVFGMYHSLEIRVPFIDHVLMDFLAKFPPEFKFQKNPNKRFLVNAIGDLPPDIYNRPKRSFTLPYDIWLKGSLKNMMLDALDKPLLCDKTQAKVLQKQFNNNSLHYSKIWALISLEKWAEKNA